jgi:KUP system potassium uptake protein
MLDFAHISILLCLALQKHSWRSTFFLAYGSLGVIYGDVGTSPLYVYSSIFTDFNPDKDDVLGAVSIIFWSLTLVALLKYVFIVLHASDQGEGEP